MYMYMYMYMYVYILYCSTKGDDAGQALLRALRLRHYDR